MKKIMKYGYPVVGSMLAAFLFACVIRIKEFNLFEATALGQSGIMTFGTTTVIIHGFEKVFGTEIALSFVFLVLFLLSVLKNVVIAHLMYKLKWHSTIVTVITIHFAIWNSTWGIILSLNMRSGIPWF